MVIAAWAVGILTAAAVVAATASPLFAACFGLARRILAPRRGSLLARGPAFAVTIMPPHGRSSCAVASSRHFASASIESDPDDNDESASESGTSPRPKAGFNRDDDSDSSFLWSWATHTDASYHDFSPRDASEIRTALLTWYRANRRKLPWRGDLPPYDGSTAGTAVNNSNGKKKKGVKSTKRAEEEENGSKRQKTMGDFFSSSSAPKRPKAVRPKRKAKGSDADEREANDDMVEGGSGAGAVENSSVKTEDFKAPEVTAYGVWVSEIMLQQTRVEAVIPYYLKWMERFPTVQTLAEADEEDINAHWAGLGFYRRARLLHAGAKLVCSDKYSGVVPSTVDELMKVNGIGRYTASAVASIAYGECVPVVDGNVCRVLSRLTGVANHIKSPALKDDLGWKLAKQIVEAGDGKHAGEVNQALMELGATYCAPTGTGVDVRDPLREFYASTRIGRAVRASSSSVEEFVPNATACRGQMNRCALCEDGGISSVVYAIGDALATSANADADADAAARAGHAALPTAPPKKAKREEVLAVAALCRRVQMRDSEMAWLMVKRPKDGLLAGQWEFPAVCVWNSADDRKNGGNSKGGKGKNGKKAVPKKGGKGANGGDVPAVSKKIRREALDSFLGEIAPSSNTDDCDLVSDRNGLGDSPLEHVFSHVRHTMWVEHGELANFSDHAAQLVTADKREARWMTEGDMKSVGITSGVRKVLHAVKLARGVCVRREPIGGKSDEKASFLDTA